MNARTLVRIGKYFVLAIAFTPGSSTAVGFDLSVTSIPKEEIRSGGPGKDGIPALTAPRFVAAGEATFLRDDDTVVGFAVGTEARAYPIPILNWHEIVNDTVAGQAVVLTYCPLTGSAVAFDRKVGDRTLTFGVSGRLFQSNVLMYDHQSESLWSQLAQRAVSGTMNRRTLRPLPIEVTTWHDWRARRPQTLVLSADTGHSRDYRRDPYADYRLSPEIMFPIGEIDPRLAPKDIVVGVRIGETAKAYPLATLLGGSFRDEVGGHSLLVDWDPVARRATISEADSGEVLPSVVAYWFAWDAFHPDAELWGGPVAATPVRSQIRGEVVTIDNVSIEEHSANWTNLLGVAVALMGADVAGDNPPLLVVGGVVKNSSAQALHHVRLVFELLDRDGRVVLAEPGYNRRAEALRPIDSPVPLGEDNNPLIEPLAGGSVDSFRMIFLGRDIPKFDAYRVRVLEAPTVVRSATAR